MTKNTARRKKRKNLKLRRTIRKTIAALIMIMAVIVAGLPVENLGTMQAQTSSAISIPVSDLYNDYRTYMEANPETENQLVNKGGVSDATSYNPADVADASTYEFQALKITEINNEAFLDWQYLLDYRGTSSNKNDMVIVGFNKTNRNFGENIVVEEQLYTKYFVITQEHENAVLTALAGEKYVVTFDVDDKQQSSYWIPESDGGGQTKQFVLPLLKTSSKDNNSIYNQASTATNDANGIRYQVVSGRTNDFNSQTIFERFMSSEYDSIKSNIEAYNDRVVAFGNDLKSLGSQTISHADYIRLTQTAQELETLYNKCKEISCNFDSLKANDDFVKFCVENRFVFYQGSFKFSVYGFDLKVAQGDAKGDDAKYIPKWIKKKGGATYKADLEAYDGEQNRSQYIDPQGYIGLETARVSGIGNEAFKGCENFKNITFNTKIEFIGNDAFFGCTYLNSVDLRSTVVVGNRAFKECIQLQNVQFSSDDANSQTRVLGAEAFYHTSLSNGIEFPNTLQQIGRGCFATSGISKFKIKQNNNENIIIWPFAFYDCTNLGNPGDGTTEDSFFPDQNFIKKITIGMGAFASSGGTGVMTEFTFPNNMTQIIDKNASNPFKLDEALDNLFTTAGKTIDEETYYDYILAGRSGLKRVVLPIKLGLGNATKIPDNTLKGCTGLECLVFGEMSISGTNMKVYYDVLAPDGTAASKVKEYDTDEDGEALLLDIANINFYIEGPGYISSDNRITPSEPRRVTALAQTAASNTVPYAFLVNENPREERIEMSYGDNHECLAVLEVVSDTTDPKEVKLVEFLYNGTGTQVIKDLVIKSRIGNYRLTGLGEGCFADVKDHVYELVIEDGSVTTIENNAFNGSKTLRKVTIGNSVKNIGEGAFAGCNNLENVYFSSPQAVNSVNDSSTPDEWAAIMEIGDSAFHTGSEYLTFHGDIHAGYAPFKLAMSGYDFGSKASNRTICYKTDAPKNLTVIYDHEYEVSTLVDYPHYKEIDKLNDDYRKAVAKRKNASDIDAYKITDNFEAYNQWKSVTAFTPSAPESGESAIIAATYDLELPNGIQSVDVKQYIKYSKNAPNLDYLYLTYAEDDTGKNIGKLDKNSRKLDGIDIKELYSNDNAGSGSDITTAGLFSGYYLELDSGIVPGVNQDKIFNGKTMHKEEQTSGNDQLLEVSLNTVEKLPSYAFESCENLNSVALGTKLSTFGNVPFRGCESLTSIDTSKNDYFTCVEGIIYHLPSNTAGSDLGTGYVIEECLMTRGQVVGYKSINSTTDPYISQVSGIKPEAFSYCQDVQTIDLSDSSITVVPEGCFRGASLLKEVTLPESISRIDSKAFSETTAKVTIYSTTCQIESDAFDNGNGIIRGYKYADGTNTKYSTAYQYAQNHKIQFEELDAKYELKFLDFDGSHIETQYVESGKDGLEPNWTPTRKGYNFKEWSWEKTDKDGKLSIVTGDKAYRNVTENRIILATYTVGSGIVSDGNDYTLTISGGKNIAGETTMTIKGGTAVSIIADDKGSSAFQYWSESTGKYAELFENIHSGVTTFIMPNESVTITSNYTDGSSGTGSGGSGSGSGGSGSGDSETKYKLTVNYGSGTGEYKAGEVVSISAFAPESSSKVFSKWTSTNTGVGFANATSATTSITMPAAAVTVTANYKTRTADEDDDSELEALNKRKPSTTTTVTTGTNNATVTTTTGTMTNATTTPTTTPTGDNITINKGGISNTGVASTQVEGAADNFVVKVTDSAAAVTEAEEALKNKYGSLDGILYFPMDISLYDVTGKNLITDTTGLDVKVTLPIPDDLIQYGGNVRVAAIENGQLRDLNVRFTTIDGIACMSFVPPHFSPYVIYVDTNNLVAGQMLDSTPKTGDPIHPKWFLAIGMACLSVILFTTGDKKKKIRNVIA